MSMKINDKKKRFKIIHKIGTHTRTWQLITYNNRIEGWDRVSSTTMAQDLRVGWGLCSILQNANSGIHTSHCRPLPEDRGVGLPSNDRGDRHSHRCRLRPDANACAMSDAMNAGRAWHGHGHASDVHDGRKHEVSVTDVKDVYWL